MSNAPLFFIIAGEASGDQLGADLMRGLARETQGAARFKGIGGPLMQAEGLDSLVPMDRLSVMGVTEVLPRLPELLRLIRETGDAVVAAAPEALITIDSPDFCLRVAKRARKSRPDLRTVHYVAPSVWAWRPGRAAKMARVIDHVLALLPFEPPYMTAAGMRCDFVGHPVVAVPPASAEDRARLRDTVGAPDPATRLIALLPGSRAGEVVRHGMLFREVWERLHQTDPTLRCVVPAVAARVPTLRQIFAECAAPVHILDPTATENAPAMKHAAFAEATAALAVSGTVSLELAAAGTPMVVAYKTSRLSAAMVRLLVKVRYASLVNIIADAPIIPEFFMDDASTPQLTQAIQTLLDDPAQRAAQTDRFAATMTTLGRGALPPGQRAAQSVLAFIE